MANDAAQQQSNQPTPEEQQVAAQDEQMAEMEAVIGHLRARVVGLNIEVRRAHARVAELEAELVARSRVTPDDPELVEQAD